MADAAVIPGFLRRAASGRKLAIAVFLAVGFSLLMFQLGPWDSLKASAGGPVLEEQMGYGPAEVTTLMEALGPQGRGAYRRFQVIDLINAVFVASALALLLTWTLTRLCRPGSPLGALVYLPLALLLAEVLENSLLFTLAGAYPALPAWIGLASGVTQVKLLLGFVAFPVAALSVLAVLGLWAWRRRAG